MAWPAVPNPVLPPGSPTVTDGTGVTIPPTNVFLSMVLVIPNRVVPARGPRAVRPIGPVAKFGSGIIGEWRVAREVPRPIVGFVGSVFSPCFPGVEQLVPVMVTGVRNPVGSPGILRDPDTTST